MGTNVNARGDKFRPNASVSARSSEVEGHRWNGSKDGFDEGFPPRPVLRGGAVDAMEKFRSRNCCNSDSLVWIESTSKEVCKAVTERGSRCARAPLKVDQDRGI